VLLTVISLVVPVILALGALGTPVSVKVEPPAQTVIAGSSFSVNVTVENVTNLGADQATLHFEPRTMQVAQITEGALLKAAGPTLGAGMEIINNSAGFLTFFCALTTKDSGANGSGTLASILFTTNSSANATALVTLSDLLLADANGTVIPVEGIANATVNIVEPVQPVFDTGRGSYPSISGIHNGTITPSVTLNVSKLYTYPCPGTAGHAEYARLANENESWSIETVPWPGYVGEWHYLDFPQPVMLQANETYHYTLRTASYPELIHLPLHETTGGTITCSEFVDANGNTRSGWIPAIRLE
jgi:hypothetical protein